MIVTERSSILTERHTIRRKVLTPDPLGGRAVVYQDLGDVDGSRIVDQLAEKEYFTKKLDLLRQALVVIDDTLGLKMDDRLLDAAGTQWEILGWAKHGPLKKLRLKEALV